VNDEMKAMYNELRALDGVRQADLEKSDSLIEEIEEAEIELATSITIARELLGSSHLAVVALIGTTDAGQLVESEELGVWAAFSGALGDEDKAKDKFKKAKEEQQLPVRIGGHSTRAKDAAAKKGAASEAKAVEFRNATEAIDDATAKVAEFRSKLVAPRHPQWQRKRDVLRTRARTAPFSRKFSATRESKCSGIGTVLSLPQIAASF
jgi:hypothetical protein